MLSIGLVCAGEVRARRAVSAGWAVLVQRLGALNRRPSTNRDGEQRGRGRFIWGGRQQQGFLEREAAA